MTIAQAFYKQYLTLPKKVRKEVLTLIENDFVTDKNPIEQQIFEGLKEIKLIQQGKLKARDARELLSEL
jgi:hypothetical protein